MFDQEWVEYLADRHGWELAGRHQNEQVVFARFFERRVKTVVDGYDQSYGCSNPNELLVSDELLDEVDDSVNCDIGLKLPLGEMADGDPTGDLEVLNSLVPDFSSGGKYSRGRWSRGTCDCGCDRNALKYEEVVPVDTTWWGPTWHDGEGIWNWDEDKYVEGCSSEKLKQTFMVWCTTGTTGSNLKHPKTGQKRTLYRRLELHNCKNPNSTLGQLFANPRQHTGYGYYTKVGRELCGPA